MDMLASAAGFVADFIAAMGWGEKVSTLTGLIYIVLSVRQNPLCWPFGIVSVAVWMVIVFAGRLYMDAFLQLVYVVLGFYGWYQWLRGGADSTPLPVRRVSARLWAWLCGLGLAATVPLGLVSQHVLHASFPWWDTVTTVLSLMAQYLLAKKYLENWVLWIIADAVYVGIYIAKGWPGYSVLMGIYTVMAVAGFVSWRRSMERGGAVA